MQSLPRVGSEYATYRLEGVLGRGGMSVVYRAQNMRLGNHVALKVLAPELAESDAFRERFVRESSVAASISHPNIIPIYDAGDAEDLLYIAMRYVDGCDLKELVRRQGPLAPQRALALFAQVASALDAAHAHKLIHRDIKPANILVEPVGIGEDVQDHAYLADFGLTKHLDSTSGLTHTGQFVGTIDYIAPEQIQGRQVDERSDLYSLACVVFQCLSGSVPFERDGDAAVLYAHLSDPPPRLSTLRPDLPPAVDAVLARALAKDPQDRYPGARQLMAALRGALEAPGESPAAWSREVLQPSALAPLSQGSGSGAVGGPATSGGATGGQPEDAPAAGAPRASSPGMPRGGWIAIAVLAAIAIGGVGVAVGALLSGGSSGSGAAGHGPGARGQDAVVNLDRLIPAPLLGDCQSTAPTPPAVAAVNCPARPDGVSTSISEYGDTAALLSAYSAQIARQGLKRNETPGNCHLTGTWTSESTWNHPRTSVKPVRLGGRRACFQDGSGRFHILWIHERTNDPSKPPQSDHRDVLVDASTAAGEPANLRDFWRLYHPRIGLLDVG